MLEPVVKLLKRIAFWIFRNKDFVLFPSIREKDDLDHLLYKLSFMFPGKKIFYSGPDKSTAAKPGYLGDIKLSPTIYNVSIIKIIFLILTLRIVLTWNCKNPLLKKLTLLPQVYNVDYKRNRMEGWNYFYAYNLAKDRRNSPNAFFNFENIPKRSKCYAFGTGESLDTAYNYNFNDGYRIVCNSMIKNIHLMKHIEPDFLVFADAIYHFGPSVYAFAFRNALVEFVKRFPSCVILIPENLYHHFIENHPHLKDKVFSIPPDKHKKVIIDLKKEYSYHRFENILNLLILPIASTLSDNIYFLGFDGRSEEIEGFWKYSNKNNFIDLLPMQKLAHPGFFTGRNYEADTGNFSDQTELIMQYGEGMGKSYYSLNTSNNKAMKKRFYS